MVPEWTQGQRSKVHLARRRECRNGQRVADTFVLQHSGCRALVFDGTRSCLLGHLPQMSCRTFFWEDAKCDAEHQQRKKNKLMSMPHQVIERGLWCTFVVQAFRIVFTGARTGHVDDFEECEWSLCSSVSLASLLSSCGKDLSFRCRH